MRKVEGSPVSFGRCLRCSVGQTFHELPPIDEPAGRKGDRNYVFPHAAFKLLYPSCLSRTSDHLEIDPRFTACVHGAHLVQAFWPNGAFVNALAALNASRG